MEFSSDKQTCKTPRLLDEFLRHVAHDYEPLFVGDEATVWDVSMDSAEEILNRCSEHYGIAVSMEDLNQPLGCSFHSLMSGAECVAGHGRRELAN